MFKLLAIAVCVLFPACVAVAGKNDTLSGTVTYTDASPAAGTVIYVPDNRRPLNINNNVILVAENIPRTITDFNGRFQLKGLTASDILLFARDMEDNCVFVLSDLDTTSDIRIIMPEPATIKGVFLKGDEPVKNQAITAYYKSPRRALQYSGTCKTDGSGQFEFRSLMPGDYHIQVAHEVPQVGCCFKSVITKQAEITAGPGSKNKLKLGGTDLPFLTGKITDTEGNGLHGVWIRLERIGSVEGPDSTNLNTNMAWSEVTEKDGYYQIFDIPPGQYTLYCFRRLVLNNSTRTLQAEKTITIKGNTEDMQLLAGRAENTCDVEIDLEPFMPLECGQPVPPLTGTLLTGKRFDVAEHKGEIIVLHFYASWCSACVSSMADFDTLARTYGSEKVLVIGISLDRTADECSRFIAQKKIQHPQLFAGPWQDSGIRKEFRVSNVPTSFIIDADGKIAQIDLFGKVLEEFVSTLLHQ